MEGFIILTVFRRGCPGQRPKEKAITTFDITDSFREWCGADQDGVAGKF